LVLLIGLYLIDQVPNTKYMLFEVTTSSHSTLPVSKQINQTVWLHTIDDRLEYGYQLNNYGGNFVKFKLVNNGLDIDFSFFKDFILTQDLTNGILLSSLHQHDKKINSSVIHVHINDSVQYKYYDLKKLMYVPSEPVTINHAAVLIEEILVENLRSLQSQTPEMPLEVCYSAGLDSSTLAWLCYKHKIKFVAITDTNVSTKIPILPFETIVSTLTKPLEFNKNNWCGIVSDRYFCDPTHNKYIGGYYGDLVMIHNKFLYYQSKHLCTIDLDDIEQYDQRCDPLDDLHKSLKFKDRQQAINTVLNLHLSPSAQEWFLDLEIRDPYRDPRFLHILLGLDFNDLIKQAKSAVLQKIIINKIDYDAWNFLCKHKNDYKNLKPN
jgi:hypothetical protein